MAQTLPLQTDLPHYEFTVSLDGIVYLFELRWSGRESSWYASLYTEDGEPLALTYKVLPGWPLFLRVRDPRMPAGGLVPVDTTGGGTAPGLNELGDRVQIVYFEASEFPL
jgi:hypothetical protein